MRNRPDGFDIYLVNIKTMMKIAQIFVVFSVLREAELYTHGELQTIQKNLVLLSLWADWAVLLLEKVFQPNMLEF